MIELVVFTLRGIKLKGYVMNLCFFRDCNNQSLYNCLASFADNSSILLLVTDENDLDLDDLNLFFKQSNHQIVGGIYPKIIFENKLISKGVIVVSLDDELDITVINDISSQNDINHILETMDIEDVKTMFVFVDGLSSNISAIIKALFDNFGLTINYIGGGAGSLSFIQKPVIFSNNGILKDACVLATSKLASSVGVKHGWQNISEPLKVTKSRGNTIIELDYKNAFEVYKNIISSKINCTFAYDKFFDIAKSFPFGINKISGEMVVRDPIILNDDGSMVCVGEVSQGSFVSVLQGKEETLVQAALEANIEATRNCTFDAFTLFIDCISRVLFLGDNFQKELDVVYDNQSFMIGMLSLGEIANNKKFYLEFYNKTAVVAKLEKR